MTQSWINAAFYRGGSSKGVFFNAADLPETRDDIANIYLSVLGSPDPYGRQLNGMGGGLSSLSKAVMIGPSARADADVDYTFAQVAVDRPIVDWGANCGNLSSAVGPFAVDEGLVDAKDGEALVRIHQVNTSKIIHARFPVIDGKAETQGDFAIAGVAGTGAKIALDFLDPGGTVTNGLLPTGNVIDRIKISDGTEIEVSLIDATNPVVFVSASALGMTGAEGPDEIEARPGLMARLDEIRRLGGVLMGLGATPEAVGLSNPKVALVGAPARFQRLDKVEVEAGAYDVSIRMVSMERAHRAVTLTAAMCLGAACRIEGTIAQRLCRPNVWQEIRIGNPSGVLPVGADVSDRGGWNVKRTTAFRTARCLMRGTVSVPNLGRL
ncbi:PrpF domain-containing protein [Mesorhizobium sp. SB112]|uniref:2-methylaconitate cis-trans isomerase PrpF family protein n=1 Tax=Mesorhizobium sp. SB112 TaxID=3151853 RepID=UPI00326412B1